MKEHKHEWFPTTVDKDGHPVFRMNRQMSPEPLVHVRCGVCGCRTWYAKSAWAELTAQRAS